MRIFCVFCFGVAALFSIPANSQTSYPHFQDVARASGLSVSHISGEKRYILESMSGGVGLFDCDNDGKLDVVVVNGSTVDRFRQGGDLLVTLYHQDSDFHFTDITQQAGLTRKGWGMGIAVADFDNDGRLDLFVTGYGGAALYRNLGNCKFEDVTERAGLKLDGLTTGAAWADYDRDGLVDLFVARYVHVDINKLPEPGSDQHDCRYKGLLVQCGPWGMEGETDFLFHNRGDGTFEDVSKKAGVSDLAKHYGLGAAWGDYDNDGWPDLYVANDAGPNYLYHNKHDGTFEEVGLLSGTALSGEGQEQGSMGVDFGDFDHDGLLDIMVTNFAEQADDLYHNEGATRGFLDLAWSSKMGQAVYPYVRWGTGRFKASTLVFTGEGTIFEGKKGMRKADARKQAILLAHLSNDAGVYWTKPTDLAYAADKPLPQLFGKYGGGRLQVILVDGTFRNIDQGTDEKTLRDLIEQSSPKTPKEAKVTPLSRLEACWSEFGQNADEGTKKAWQDISIMIQTPGTSVPFLKDRLKPVPRLDQKQIDQWLVDLDSRDFQTRDLAAKNLGKAGDLALPALAKKLDDKKVSLEARRRVESLMEKNKTVLSGEELRAIRGIEVLEGIGTPDAKEVLDALAHGCDGAVITEQAKNAQARLGRQSPRK